MRTKNLIDKAFDALKKHLVLNLEWQIREEVSDRKDGLIRMVINNQIMQLPFEMKEEVRKYQIQQFVQKTNQDPNFVIIASKIPDTLKTELRNLGIQYIDSAGNAFLRTGSHHIYSNGLKYKQENMVEKKLFTTTGTKLIFYLLLDQKMINSTYRDIASLAEISLDSITKTFKVLKKLEYLINLDEFHYSLNNKRDLFDKWLDGYETKLKPKINKGTYRFLDKNYMINWQEIALNNKRFFWGGEPAGAILTDYLKPEKFCIYTSLRSQELLKDYKLAPSEEGNVEINELFFKPEIFNCEKTVPPLLVYADLLLSGDSRNRETADLIYEKYLSDKIG